MGELFELNMRDLVGLLLSVAEEYNDKAPNDRFFAAVDAFNTVLKGEGFVQRVDQFGKFGEEKFDPAAFETQAENPENDQNGEQKDDSKRPNLENGAENDDVNEFSDGSLLGSTNPYVPDVSIDAPDHREDRHHRERRD